MMLARLDKNKKLVPPRTLLEGERRKDELEAALKKIKEQLQHPRAGKSAEELADWERRARGAHSILSCELEQLVEWLAGKRAECEVLLKRAYGVLMVLEAEIDLEPEEMSTLEDIGTYLADHVKREQAA